MWERVLKFVEQAADKITMNDAETSKKTIHYSMEESEAPTKPFTYKNISCRKFPAAVTSRESRRHVPGYLSRLRHTTPDPSIADKHAVSR